VSAHGILRFAQSSWTVRPLVVTLSEPYGGSEIHLPALVLYVLCHVPQAAAQPTLPNMEPLLYSAVTLSTIPPDKRLNWEESVRVGVALAKLLNRHLNKLAGDNPDLDYLLSALSVLQLFDEHLRMMNPFPTCDEVAARVRVYRPWLIVVRQAIERRRANGVEDWQTDAQFYRTIRCFEECYGPFFTRDF
jgi:hypothetical protein